MPSSLPQESRYVAWMWPDWGNSTQGPTSFPAVSPLAALPGSAKEQLAWRQLEQAGNASRVPGRTEGVARDHPFPPAAGALFRAVEEAPHCSAQFKIALSCTSLLRSPFAVNGAYSQKRGGKECILRAQSCTYLLRNKPLCKKAQHLHHPQQNGEAP